MTQPKLQMRSELKAYVRKHDLEEHGALVNELFGIYNITEKLEDLRTSENASDVVQGSTKSSDDDVQSATSSIRSRNLQPKSLNSDVARASTTVRSVSKESVQKKSPVARTTRGSVARSSDALKRAPANTAPKSKSAEEAVKPKSGQEKFKINKQGSKTVNAEGNIWTICTIKLMFFLITTTINCVSVHSDNLGSVTENEEGNKENMVYPHP